MGRTYNKSVITSAVSIGQVSDKKAGRRSTKTPATWPRNRCVVSKFTNPVNAC